MSEDAAYRRSKAARLVREFPELHDAVAKGEIHLTGVLMIGPYLGGEHHAEVLRRARFRSKRELLRLIQLRALRALVQQLRARKRGAAKAPPPPAQDSFRAPEAPARVPGAASDPAPARRGSRHIPASVRRAVYDRDGGRCAYRDDRGERCRETAGLEIHHRDPYARGGPPTLHNLELRCRPHNTLAAEEDFGREHMDLVRGVADRAAADSRV